MLTFRSAVCGEGELNRRWVRGVGLVTERVEQQPEAFDHAEALSFIEAGVLVAPLAVNQCADACQPCALHESVAVVSVVALEVEQ
jgi:hypothetical protein